MMDPFHHLVDAATEPPWDASTSTTLSGQHLTKNPSVFDCEETACHHCMAHVLLTADPYSVRLKTHTLCQSSLEAELNVWWKAQKRQVSATIPPNNLLNLSKPIFFGEELQERPCAHQHTQMLHL